MESKTNYIARYFVQNSKALKAKKNYVALCSIILMKIKHFKDVYPAVNVI